jgi:hypothetical protein
MLGLALAKCVWRFALVIPGTAIIACDATPEASVVTCVVDRDCADGDLCNGIERCVDGLCSNGVGALCDADAVCLPDGVCAISCGERCEADPCAAPWLPTVAMVAGTHRLPVSAGAAVSLALTPVGEAPTDWHLQTPDLDLATLAPALRHGTEVVLHARMVGACGEVNSARRYTWVDPALLASDEASDAWVTRLEQGRDARRVKVSDPRIVGWAESWVDYQPGPGADAIWRDPARALGQGSNDVYDIVALGEGGTITVAFPWLLADGPGLDFVVFENAVPDDFIELAFVEVSSDGIHFARFDTVCLVERPVGSYERINGRLVDGFAGPGGLGVGVGFDLASLENHPLVVGGQLDLDVVAFVRVVDVLGDGSMVDSFELSVHDPFPVIGSGGFDLEAIGVLQP